MQPRQPVHRGKITADAVLTPRRVAAHKATTQRPAADQIAGSSKSSFRRAAADVVPRGQSAGGDSSSSTTASALKTPLEKLLDSRVTSTSTLITSPQSLVQRYSSRGGEMGSTWSQEMPSPILFASNKPTGTADAAILNRWITSALDRYAAKMAAGEGQPATLPQMVDELVPLLSLGLHELTRQVTQKCAERGVILEKIWRTYVELFDRALAETRELLRFHKQRTWRVEDALKRASSELEAAQRTHPLQIEKLSTTLSSKFMQRQEELEGLLKSVRKENSYLREVVKDHVNSTRSWFPRFDDYSKSSIHDMLVGACPELPATTTPESRIAADFKRILLAMPADARRRVGFFVSSLLGLRGTEWVENPDTVESLTERKEHNAWQIGLLEERIQELENKSPKHKRQHIK